MDPRAKDFFRGMKTRAGSFSAILAAALLAGSSARGGGNAAETDAVARKSAAIWEESTRRKMNEGLDAEGGGDLQVGGAILRLTRLKLRLGPLKTPGDLHGGQAPSELFGKGKGAGRFAVGGITLSAATTLDQVSGQTFEIGPKDAAEIVMPDGAAWRLKEGGINFLQASVSNVHLLIEGRAVPSNNLKASAVRVTGELTAGLELSADQEAEPAEPGR